MKGMSGKSGAQFRFANQREIALRFPPALNPIQAQAAMNAPLRVLVGLDIV